MSGAFQHFNYGVTLIPRACAKSELSVVNVGTLLASTAIVNTASPYLVLFVFNPEGSAEASLSTSAAFVVAKAGAVFTANVIVPAVNL